MPLVRKAKLKHLGWVGDDTPLSLPKTSSGSDNVRGESQTLTYW